MLQDQLKGYAEYEAKAEFVASPDACPTCAALAGKVFDPLRAPRIPVVGCAEPPCRCDYTPRLV